MIRWQTLCAVDFDKAAAATYHANFPGVDVRCCAVAEAIPTLPDCDVILGGPPCQGFSLAGKRKGVDDSRNGWPDFISAVAAKLPRMLLAENVPGMLTEKHLPYSRQVFKALEALGYVMEKRMLDAVNYGVPQFRKRVFFWGIRADLYAAGIRHRWPEPTHEWPWDRRGMFSLLPAVTVGQALGIGPCAMSRVRTPESTSANGPFFDSQAPCASVTGIPHSTVGKDTVQAFRERKAGPRRVTTMEGHRRPLRQQDITARPCDSVTGYFTNDVGPRVEEYRWSPERDARTATQEGQTVGRSENAERRSGAMPVVRRLTPL